MNTPLPFHLQGNFAPVERELFALDLPVDGRLPPALDGIYVRNGPNPRSGSSPHWLVGDGMVHGVAISGGRARWYRNRYVGTAAALEPQPPGPRTLGRGRNNTHVVAHAGRLLALVEVDLPLELDRELATVGPYDFGGAIAGPVTAHPKRCPRTGELHAFGYQFESPYLTYVVADAGGRVIARRPIEVSGPSYLHDFALTERHAVFFDTPARMIAPWGAGTPMPFRWADDVPTRVVVVPRDDPSGPVQRFELAPCVLGHTANGFERDGRIVVDGIHYPRLDEPPATLHRWELDLTTGSVAETQLDDRLVEFPRIDDRRTGLAHRYTYLVELRLADGKPAGSLLRRHDGVTGEARSWDLGTSQMPGECVFVPMSFEGDEAPEDAGWLLTFAYDAERDGSDLLVLDARDFGSPPIARIRLPQRVPFGFHGSWVPSAELG